MSLAALSSSTLNGIAQSSLAQGFGITLASHLYVAPVPVLSTGMPALDRLLPDQGIPQGQVIELSAASSSSLSTTLSLALCREAQQQAVLQGGESWCAFIDPSEALYAPGVAQAGVSLERLLVLRPPLEAVSNVAAKLAEARAFSVIVVDLRARLSTAESEKAQVQSAGQSSARQPRAGQPSAGQPSAGQPSVAAQLKQWQRMVRRMALAIENSKTAVLLLTDEVRGKSVLNALPVALRIQLQRQEVDHLAVSVTKDRQGRLTEVQQVRLPRAKRLEERSEGKRSENSDMLRAIKPLRSIRPVSANSVPVDALSLAKPLEKGSGRPKLALVSGSIERGQLNLFGGA